MFAVAGAHMAQAVSGRHILAIQDTTTLRDDGVAYSLMLHPTIAVDGHDGALLGLVHGEVVHRSGGRKGLRKTTAFDEKQSRRWLDAAHKAAGLVEAGAACVTVVGDREADIYEEFALRPPTVELLIRAAQDRHLVGGSYLFAHADGLPELGRMTVLLPAAPGRPERAATLALRAGPVALARPQRPAAQAKALPAQVPLHLVDAREINAPAGQPPAHWRLLTTHTVSTFAEAKRITAFYRERWTIEQLFRVCKTKGFDIEAVQIAEEAPYERLAVATMIAAMQVLQLVRDRDGHAKRPLEDVLDPDDQPALEAVSATLEGKTARQKNPHPRGSLAYAAWVLARLGGWTGYYGKPGPVVMLNGSLRFRAMKQGWNIGRLV